jgi:hypothetical protein
MGGLPSGAREIGEIALVLDPETVVNDAIKAAVTLVLDTAFNLLQTDPHQWGLRPCSTCRAISGLRGKPFGCEYLIQQERILKEFAKTPITKA